MNRFMQESYATSRADGDRGSTLRFGVAPSSLGFVLAAANERGLCAILLGDDAESLRRDLGRRFPQLRCVDGGDGIASIMAGVIEAIESPRAPFDLRLDPQGTAFQCRVWNALREIPRGATASYTEIARRIGAPKSARAVAAACAANALAVAVPCHRVVRSDGGLSGYRWGVERKRALLEREARA